MKVTAVVCFLLALIDFSFRVYMPHAEPKTLIISTPRSEFFQKEDLPLPEFNALLFGQQATVKEESVNVKPKQKEVVFSPVIRAIYMIPKPFALVALNQKSASQKLTINDQLLGYTLTKIDKDTLYFEKTGEVKEFRMFKK